MAQRCQGQVRTAGMGGIIGFDLPAVLEVGEALGFDRKAMATLLPFAEAGMVVGLNKKADQGLS